MALARLVASWCDLGILSAVGDGCGTEVFDKQPNRICAATKSTRYSLLGFA